jgi:hypothetical protein
VKNITLQTEHDRLLAVQEAANKKLRDLEIAKDEARALLLRALLDRDNLSPELLQIQREETLQRIKEQIEGVIKAPSETQLNVLDVTSNEIAETVGRSRAALETVKRVSNQQLPPITKPTPSARSAAAPRRLGSATLSNAAATASSSQSPLEFEGEDSFATLVTSTPQSWHGGKGKAEKGERSSYASIVSLSEVTSSPDSIRTTPRARTRTGTTWADRLARLMKSPSASLTTRGVVDGLESSWSEDGGGVVASACPAPVLLSLSLLCALVRGSIILFGWGFVALLVNFSLPFASDSHFHLT